MRFFCRVSFVFFLWSGFFVYPQAQGVSFFKENITMQIAGSHFYVSGLYYLRSEEEKHGMLLYPFPTDSLYGEVDSLIIINMNTHEVIQPLNSKDGKIRFLLALPKQEEVILQISYRQKLLGNQAEYILETTRYWGSPFEIAAYQLIIPAHMRIEHFSIPPEDEMRSGAYHVFYWEKYHYMPDRNMVFRFSNIEE